MTEILFYHLQRQPLEKVLPQLLEKSVERGWRVVVQAASDERVDALDAHLWTYRDDNFLAHGTYRENEAAMQPVLLTLNEDNPNGAMSWWARIGDAHVWISVPHEGEPTVDITRGYHREEVLGTTRFDPKVNWFMRWRWRVHAKISALRNAWASWWEDRDAEADDP